jgi:hypothetical protein
MNKLQTTLVSTALVLAALPVSAAEPSAPAARDKTPAVPPPTLPFTISVVPDELKDVPEYMGNKPPDKYMDYPFAAVAIDGDYWIFFRNQTSPRVFRYKGTNIENAQRQPDGDVSQPAMKGAYILGGMWYDETEKKLYAPLHHEKLRLWKQVSMATSSDKGLTWKYEGLIVATYDPQDKATKAGNEYEGDFYLHVDTKGGYVYLYCLHYVGQSFMQNIVARCAIKDKMAPGKWTKFRNGGWTEPGLGGTSSHVNAYYVMYNAYLQKYLSFNLNGSLSCCTDLEKQDWSPSFKIGNAWGIGRTYFGYHVTDESKKDTYAGGKTLFVWTYYMNRWGGRHRIELGTGETSGDKEGFHPFGGYLDAGPRVSMVPGMMYPYDASPGASDPILARRTRKVPCDNPETTYSGNWTGARDPKFHLGGARMNDEAGAAIRFAFKGRDVYWRAWMGTDCGKADVYLDDRLESTVDCYARPEMGYPFAFIKTGLDAEKTHTIRIVARGEKNPLSSGAKIKHMVFEHSAESDR